MCFMRYQRSLNSSMMKSKWTPEEDAYLCKAVAMHGQRNWQQGTIATRVSQQLLCLVCLLCH